MPQVNEAGTNRKADFTSLTVPDMLDIVSDLDDRALCRLYECAHQQGLERVENAAADKMERRRLCY